MFVWLLACTVGASPVAVIGLGDIDPAMAEKVRTSEPGAMASFEMWERLVRTPDPREAMATSLEQMLRDARDREARFDNEGAEQLRTEVLRAYHQSVRPNDEVRSVAARTAHDMVAAWLAQGNLAQAERHAAEALRLFPDTRLDTARHPPPVVRLVERVRKRLNRSPRARLQVTTDLPGTILVEGIDLGRVEKHVIERDLPLGFVYRVWWRGDDGAMSLPHIADLTRPTASVSIPAALERDLHLLPAVRLACATDCGPRLRALGQRLGAARVIGVRANSPGMAVDVVTGAETPWPDVTLTTPPSEPEGFSAWYLMPFGGGQFAQDRPIAGTLWAVAETALLAWHLVSWQQHADAVTKSDFDGEPDLRITRNLSAGLFYGSVAAGILEAVLVGWVFAD